MLTARYPFHVRVIHVVEQVDYPWGGLSYSIPKLCSELIARGNDIRLISLTDFPNRQRPDYATAFFPRNRRWSPIQLGWSAPLYRWLRNSLQSEKIHAIHVHGMWRMTSVLPCLLGARNGVPVVLAPRGTLTPEAMQVDSAKKKLFWMALQRNALRKVTCFHATGEPEAEHLRNLGFKQPIAVIPNGVDIPAAVGHGRPFTRTVLYLGRVHRIKGLDTLLHAWSSVEPQRLDWQLRIVGPDNEGHLAELRALAKSLMLQRVTFEQPAQSGARLDAYAHASVYILPSRSENFGMTVAEALAAGTPVIATRGTPWSGLERERCGWWVEPSAAALSETLLAATLLPASELQAMGERGRAWMERDYGWKPIAAQAEATYRWLDAGMPEAETPRFVRRAQ